MISQFNHFIFYPDLANKFLLASVRNIIPSKRFNIQFVSVFTNLHTYAPLAIKILLIMESIFTKRCLSNSRIIRLRFGKARCHSTISLILTLEEVIPLLQLYIRKPMTIKATINTYLREAKYFSFPGYINQLKFPSWNRYVCLSLNQHNTNLYTFLLYKAAFFD